jgi:hypothetical protein
VDKWTWYDKFTHQKNNFVAPLNVAFRLPSIGSDNWHRFAIRNQCEWRKARVYDTTNEFQLQIIDQVMANHT